jgi:MafB19-like deaminase
LSDVFQELAAYREQLDLPPAGSETDRDTVAKLEIGDMVFFGVNSSSNPTRRQITLRVNPISRTHAEADAFQQAYDLGIRGGKARLIVDRDLCRACGQNGGVKGMARQLDIEELEVISPSGYQLISLK